MDFLLEQHTYVYYDKNTHTHTDTQLEKKGNHDKSNSLDYNIITTVVESTKKKKRWTSWDKKKKKRISIFLFFIFFCESWIKKIGKRKRRNTVIGWMNERMNEWIMNVIIMDLG